MQISPQDNLISHSNNCPPKSPLGFAPTSDGGFSQQLKNPVTHINNADTLVSGLLSGIQGPEGESGSAAKERVTNFTCRLAGSRSGEGYGYDKGDGNGVDKNMKIAKYSCHPSGGGGNSVTVLGGTDVLYNNGVPNANPYGGNYVTRVNPIDLSTFSDATSFSSFPVDIEPGWWTRTMGSGHETDYTMHKAIDKAYNK